MKRIAFLLLACLLFLGGCTTKNATNELAAGTPVIPVNKPEPGTETWQQHGQIPYSEMWALEKEAVNFIRGNTEYGELTTLREAITIGDTCYYGNLMPVYDPVLKNAELIGTLSAEPCEAFTTPLRHLQTTFNQKENVQLCRGELPGYTTAEGYKDFYLVYEDGSMKRFFCDTTYPPYYDDGRWIIAPVTVSYENLSFVERNAVYALYHSDENYSGETIHLNPYAIRVDDTCYFGWMYSFAPQVFPENIPEGAKRLGTVSGTCASFTTPTEDLQVNFDLRLLDDSQMPIAYYSETFLHPDGMEMAGQVIYLVHDTDRVQYFFVETTEVPAYYDENRWMVAPAWLPRH